MRNYLPRAKALGNDKIKKPHDVLVDFSPGASATRREKFKVWKPRNDLYWLDDVQCNGDEESLFKCPCREIGKHNCGLRERAGVECLSM